MHFQHSSRLPQSCDMRIRLILIKGLNSRGVTGRSERRPRTSSHRSASVVPALSPTPSSRVNRKVDQSQFQSQISQTTLSLPGISVRTNAVSCSMLTTHMQPISSCALPSSFSLGLAGFSHESCHSGTSALWGLVLHCFSCSSSLFHLCWNQFFHRWWEFQTRRS